MSSKDKTQHDSQPPVRWMDDVEAHDYDAAESYLTLKMSATHARKVVASMKDSKLTYRRPNDVLRAAGLPALPMADPGVHRDLMKLLTGKELSPVLVIDAHGSCDIADGYHRVSLCYNIDPFMSIPMRIGQA